MRMSPVGPIVLGVGGAALIAGVVTGSLALRDGDALRSRCGGLVCSETETDDVSAVEALSNATDALLFGGAAVAVTGLVLTLVLQERVPVEPAVACGPFGCSISLAGMF
jgi:hypothetical protein